MGPVSPGVWKSSAKLADGRDIIYFDEAPGLRAGGQCPGHQATPAASRGTARRRDRHRRPMAGCAGTRCAASGWSSPPQRQDRTFLPPHRPVPARPVRRRAGQPRSRRPDYDVVVFENRFPRCAARATGRRPRCPPAPAAGVRRGPPRPARPLRGGLLHLRPRRVVRRAQPAAGAHRGARPGRTGPQALSAHGRQITQVYCFENQRRGDRRHAAPPARADLRRSRSSPRGPASMLAQARRVRRPDHAGGNLFDDLVAAETAGRGTRIVTRNEHWIAFVPDAARWPYEVRLFPADRVPDLTGAQRRRPGTRSAPLYLDVLRRFDALFGHARCRTSPPGTRPRCRDGDRAPPSSPLHLQVLSVRRATWQAEVPRRNRIRHGRVDQRHRPRRGGAAAPGGRMRAARHRRRRLHRVASRSSSWCSLGPPGRRPGHPRGPEASRRGPAPGATLVRPTRSATGRPWCRRCASTGSRPCSTVRLARSSASRCPTPALYFTENVVGGVALLDAMREAAVLTASSSAAPPRSTASPIGCPIRETFPPSR